MPPMWQTDRVATNGSRRACGMASEESADFIIGSRMTLEDTYTSPIGFITKKLELELYPWQEDAVTPLEFAAYGSNIVQISVLAPNEGGKSSRIVAGGACYWLAMHAKGTVAITTKDGKQLKEQVIPAIEEQVSKFEGWHSVQSPYYRVTTSTGGRIIAYTTEDAGRVEGFHGKPDAPLLYIVDEAKSVPEKIFDGIDRCGFQALIYASSGGMVRSGTFYDSHHGELASQFIKVRAGLTDCPHIAQSKIDRIIAKHGIDAPFTRSSLFGEFMEQSDEDEYCVDLRSLLNCIDNPPKHRTGVKAGFFDWGEGVAEHVFAVRDGNKYEIAAAWIESNKDATASRAIREMIKAGFKPDDAPARLWCDASDKEIAKKIADNGWNLKRQNFGAPPRLTKEYKSWSAEAWIEGGLKISLNEPILPDDELLKTQMISRKKGYAGAGLRSVEDKLSLKERGIPSPDRADAIFGVMSIPEQTVYKDPFPMDSWREVAETAGHGKVLASIGAGY
jgi:hypothetical protein